jgi:hypothetical protein
VQCRSGGRCEQAALEGERFCALHLEELHRIRAAFQDESKLKDHRERKPTCQTPGCANARVPPNPLCSECAEDAIDELAA